MNATNVVRRQAFSFGGIVSMLFAPLCEFMTYYERAPASWLPFAAGSALAIAAAATRLSKPLQLSGRIWLIICGAFVTADFVWLGSQGGPALVWHLLMTAGTFVCLAKASGSFTDTVSAPLALRWGIGGGMFTALAHPSLALALGGNDGWWLAAAIILLPLLFTWPSAVTNAAGNAENDTLLRSMALIAGLFWLLFMLPAYFDYRLGMETAAPLGTVALFMGIATGTIISGYGRFRALRWSVVACGALALLPLKAAAFAQIILLLTGVGLGTLFRSRLLHFGRTPFVLLAAASGALAAGLTLCVLLSGASIGTAGQLGLAVLTATLPFGLFAFSASRQATQP